MFDTCVKKVMECFCELYVEGLTIENLKQKTGLSNDEIEHVLSENRALFMVREVKSNQSSGKFIYLRRARSLKCAYTLYRYSNITSLDFGWNKTDRLFIFELTNPKYRSRKVSSIRRSLGWTKKEIDTVISKWQDRGVICKTGRRISFTYLGWPLWASIMVYRIWM